MIHICVIGLRGVGKTHFINAVSIGHGYTIRPTTGFYEESFKLDETHKIHLVECARLDYLVLRHEQFAGLLWIVDAHADYETLQASKNYFLSIAHKFERIGVIYNVKKPQNSFRKRNKVLQLDCLAQPTFVIDVDYSQEWQEKVWCLWYFFVNGRGR